MGNKGFKKNLLDSLIGEEMIGNFNGTEIKGKISHEITGQNKGYYIGEYQIPIKKTHYDKDSNKMIISTNIEECYMGVNKDK